MLNIPRGMFVSHTDIKTFSLLPSNNREILFGTDNLLGRYYVISDPAKTWPEREKGFSLTITDEAIEKGTMVQVSIGPHKGVNKVKITTLKQVHLEKVW